MNVSIKAPGAAAAVRGAGSVQRRVFMTPPVHAGMRLVFSQNFRGRAMKKRDQLIPALGEPFINQRHSGSFSPTGRALKATKRTQDIDDPRPPIVGWKSSKIDQDGSIPLLPYPNTESSGRKILQGLYKDFKEMYNSASKFIPLYGGGPWDPREQIGARCFISRRSTLAGCILTENPCYVYPSAVIRADLNKVTLRAHSIVMEGCVITTDGHPKNVHLPGRLNRLNEGEVFIGRYSLIHPSCNIDSAYIADYCEVGEGSKLGYNSIMELGSALEPGSVLLAHQRVPRWEVWGGNPARKVGNRSKDLVAYTGYIHMVETHQVKGVMCEESVKANHVLTTRSSERLENAFERLVLKNQGTLPSKVSEYIEKGTREVPLWEEYKNLTRISVRPGVKAGTDWTVDPRKARWNDHY